MNQAITNVGEVASRTVEVAREGLKVFMDFAKEHPKEAAALTGIAGITLIVLAVFRSKTA
ncbi:MAG: hypothetical protein B7Z80_02350 [Rhodospirillales bacterium 20-64-7]|nr:MAG: hypothetical protein B7Z80_02350 [Rhodospirillales bacterium 20-64-7]